MKIVWSILFVIVGGAYIVDGIAGFWFNHQLHWANYSGNIACGMASVELGLTKIGWWPKE